MGAAADVIQSKERVYAVKYKDEAVERYVVKWTANFAASVREEGGGMIPYQGAVQTHRCAWTITSSIDRTVSLATRLGQTIPLEKMSRTIEAGSPNPATGQRADTCTASRAAHEGEIANARGALLANFERLTQRRPGEPREGGASLRGSRQRHLAVTPRRAAALIRR
jgi:hypothetical protein